MPLPRSAGVLLHPTSLPGPFGTGDLGPVAYRWVDTLAAAAQTWWQILPLGPTGFGDSPYQCFSAFAGNLMLLSPELLERDGLVSADMWAGLHFAEGPADFDKAGPFKAALVREAYARFRGGRAATLRPAYDDFLQAEASWLNGFATFMAARDALGGRPLADWPADLRRHDPAAVAAIESELAEEINIRKFGQFLFDRQWTALKTYANSNKVKIFGDIPIFVAADSADVWANPGQFLLDKTLHPTVVAGVPPDYFAEDGQHWGNPLYDWPAMAADGYAWWAARVRQCLKQSDLVRLDHFRGFAQAWHVPAAETTARNGKWVDGPGADFFAALKLRLGELPFVAEDLGVITPDVDALRASAGLPGMKVLQFGFDGPANQYLPHNYVRECVCYTGTHDNDTSVGWYHNLDEGGRRYFAEYVDRPFTDPAWELIHLAWASVARVAIAPLQDVLSIGGEGRMNVPGRAAGNWGWRVRYDQFRPETIDRLAAVTARYNRAPAPPVAE